MAEIKKVSPNSSPRRGGGANIETGQATMEELLAVLDSGAVHRSRALASMKKPKRVFNEEDQARRRRELTEEAAEKAHRPPFRGAGPPAEFGKYEGGYLLSLDPMEWSHFKVGVPTRYKYGHSFATWRPAGQGGRPILGTEKVPVTANTRVFLEKSEVQLRAFESRQRMKEGVLVPPDAFDLSRLQSPWRNPPPRAELFGSGTDIDPSDLKLEKRMQAVKLLGGTSSGRHTAR